MEAAVLSYPPRDSFQDFEDSFQIAARFVAGFFFAQEWVPFSPRREITKQTLPEIALDGWPFFVKFLTKKLFARQRMRFLLFVSR